RRRPRRPEQPRGGPWRGARRHRRHLRALPDSGGLPRAHATRPRRDASRVRVFRGGSPGKGLSTVVNGSSTGPALSGALSGQGTTVDCCISGLSTYLPPRALTNADLEKMIETSDEWILQRTGIRKRHIVDPGVATSDLSVEAARAAIEQAGLTPEDIDFIVVGTTTPDMLFPSTACLLQDKIGATRAWGFDLGAACSGFTYALTTATHFVASGTTRHALVVGADVMSSIIDYTDRTTCVLFGDGAGAVVLSPSDDRDFGILDYEGEIDGSGGPALCMPAGGSLRPASKETVEQRLHYVK